MINAIYYWIGLMGSWWNYLSTNVLLSAGLITLILVFVIKYLDEIKKIFK